MKLPTLSEIKVVKDKNRGIWNVQYVHPDGMIFQSTPVATKINKHPNCKAVVAAKREFKRQVTHYLKHGRFINQSI